MDSTAPAIGARAIMQLLTRALGGPCALVAFDADGRPQRAHGAEPDAPYLAPGFALSPSLRLELREGRRTELVLQGQRFAALGADDEGTLWVAFRPLHGSVSLPRFAQHLVHALRNSLSSVKLAGQTLEKSAALGAREKRRVAIALREIARMERIITTASEFARAPTRAGDAFDPAALLRAAVEATRPEVEARSVTLALAIAPELPQLRGDAVRTQLAFENLVVFGARAMPEGGVLEVSLAREGDAVRLVVRDHGGAVPDAERPFLFEPLSAGARAPGLDLAFAADVARELGGEAFAEDANPGLRVTVRLGKLQEGVHGHAASGR